MLLFQPLSLHTKNELHVKDSKCYVRALQTTHTDATKHITMLNSQLLKTYTCTTYTCT